MFQPLNSREIMQEIHKDIIAKKIFKGVFPRDKLPKSITFPSCFIFNTKPSTHNGEHWLAIFYNSNKEATFFDSYGFHPNKFNMVKYLENTSKNWILNDTQIQGVLSSSFGYYCIYFILFMS